MMARAVELARRGLGQTSPNPAVGAVIARGDRLIAEGWHRKAGAPHAEVEAIRAAREPLTGATLYVTLEPCSTRGKTPPCTDAILEARFARVVYGAPDPTEANGGRARQQLEAAGVEVLAGMLEEACTDLNRAWNHWVRTGRPYVIAKWAMTLDGQIGTPPDRSHAISGPESHADLMRLRREVDAILVGAGTVRADNPRLTIRGLECRQQPLRIVLSNSGELPQDAHLFRDAFAGRTRVFAHQSLHAVLSSLGEEGVVSVLIEGGSEIHGAALEARIPHEIVVYLAPTMLGGPIPAIGGLGAPGNDQASRLDKLECIQLGQDLRLTGRVRYAPVPRGA